MLELRSKFDCKLCGWVKRAQQGTLPELIWESEFALAIVGEHQFFAGYSVLVSKIHVREMHMLSSDIAAKIFEDLLKLGAAVNQAFIPWKMNYAALGNVEEHLHWHVIPRYESDSDHRDHPWKNASRFNDFASQPAEIQKVKAKILIATGTTP